jgi:hypothetical protein
MHDPAGRSTDGPCRQTHCAPICSRPGFHRRIGAGAYKGCKSDSTQPGLVSRRRRATYSAWTCVATSCGYRRTWIGQFSNYNSVCPLPANGAGAAFRWCASNVERPNGHLLDEYREEESGMKEEPVWICWWNDGIKILLTTYTRNTVYSQWQHHRRLDKLRYAEEHQQTSTKTWEGLWIKLQMLLSDYMVRGGGWGVVSISSTRPIQFKHRNERHCAKHFRPHTSPS